MTDKELLEQFQLLAGMIGDVEVRLAKKIEESEICTRVFVENTVTKRIDALFDGYKLTHEKQYELERRMEKLEQIIADLQTRIA